MWPSRSGRGIGPPLPVSAVGGVPSPPTWIPAAAAGPGISHRFSENFQCKRFKTTRVLRLEKNNLVQFYINLTRFIFS